MHEPVGPKEAAALDESIHYLRLAALALNYAARECYLEQAVDSMKQALLMEELGR